MKGQKCQKEQKLQKISRKNEIIENDIGLFKKFFLLFLSPTNPIILFCFRPKVGAHYIIYEINKNNGQKKQIKGIHN